MAEFDEAQHPRAPDGKFGANGGSRAAAILAKAREGKLVKPVAGAPASHPSAEHHERRVAQAREFAEFQAHAKVLEEYGASARGAKATKIKPALDAAAAKAGAHAEAQARSEIANEQRALSAGHITPPPDDKLKAFEGVAGHAATKLEHIHQTLDASARRAADETAKLAHMHDELSSAGITEHDDAHGELRDLEDAFAGSQAIADAAHQIRAPHEAPPEHQRYETEARGRQGIDNEREFSYHEPPERDHEDTDAEHAERVADFHAFRAAVDDHHARFRAQAEATQTALEELHAAQSAALKQVAGDLKIYGKAHAAAVKEVDRLDEHDLVSEKAFEHHPRNDDDEISDPRGAADYDAAREASSSLISSEVDRRSSMNAVDAGDVTSAIREGMRTTAANVRSLSRITGRAPALVKAGKEPADD